MCVYDGVCMTLTQSINEARTLVRSGSYLRAIALCRELLAKHRSHAELLYLMGSSLTQLGRYSEARSNLIKASKANPNVPEILHELALTYQGDQRFDEADAVFDRALAIAPGSLAVIAAKADLLRIRGKYDEAMALIDPHTDDAERSPQLMFVYLRLAPKVGRAEQVIEAGARSIENSGLTAVAKMRALFALGHVYDTLGRCEEAFECYRRGNGLAPVTFNPQGHAAAVDRIIEGWSGSAQSGVELLSAADARGSERAVFIVGMPRSGTSLIEQILASHPEISGGGELSAVAEIIHAFRGPDTDGLAPMPDSLNPKSLGRSGRSYLQALRKIDSKAARVTDKSPDNMYHLGFLSKMLPDARFIFVRRDFRDTCVSCYMNTFRGAYTFTNDFSHLATYAHDTQRLLDHWRGTLGDRMHIVRYESLVENIEAVAKPMVGFLGLDWDDACLRYTESDRVTMTLSNEQVREPIYTRSVGRWKRYENWIGPLLDGLRARGVDS